MEFEVAFCPCFTPINFEGIFFIFSGVPEDESCDQRENKEECGIADHLASDFTEEEVSMQRDDCSEEGVRSQGLELRIGLMDIEE